MDWQHIERHWDDYKKRIKQKWNGLSDREIDLIRGQRQHLETAIQRRYGFTFDFVRKEIDDWFRWQTEAPRPIDYQDGRVVIEPKRKVTPRINSTQGG
jgi:uncharacterized protein YjbJ (UPF0337 family)